MTNDGKAILSKGVKERANGNREKVRISPSHGVDNYKNQRARVRRPSNRHKGREKSGSDESEGKDAGKKTWTRAMDQLTTKL